MFDFQGKVLISVYFSILWYSVYTIIHITMSSVAERLTKRLMLPAEKLLPLLQTIGEINVLNNEFQRSEHLSPQTLGRLSRSILVTSAGASNRIEGNKLTDEQVENLYKNMRAKKFLTRDEQEVAGYLEVLELIFSSYEQMHFSEGLILQLHQQMLAHSDKDSGQRGKYKF